MSTDKVKVAVRVRPFNRRETELGTKCVIDMDPTQTVLFHPSTGVKELNSDGPQHSTKKSPKTFAFDHCFWSIEESNEKFAGQDSVFQCLGTDILERAFEGYNACIFAYGQTGSGKSYTMMGTREQKGIIPRLCDHLFDRIASNEDDQLTHKVEVSYMEIYNEKVRDLLDPNGKHNLKVREHNILGPYVDGLSTLAVASFEDIENLMVEGNKSRTVAATNMNSESSRSHAVFNIILTQTITDTASGVSGEKVSKMSLVDLAGSERAQKTGAVGDRLREGSNINKSLTTLGLVISALADQASGKSKNKFTPYRDSVLTWLLKDNLGGNSKTVMVATLSPAADNYEETLSTLRYADRAKRIVNHAVVNEDPNARIIRELREEVEMLKLMLGEAQIIKQDENVKERLAESEKLMKEMSKTWEEKLRETEQNHQERHATLEKMGISVQTSGIKVEQGKYYLVNLNADPSLNELLVYYLKEHTLVGRPDAPKVQDIQLSGLGIVPEHCVFDIEDSEVYISPIEGARTCVNGRTITEKTKVKHGDRILWGNNHFFRINCPKANSPSTETPENIDYDFAQQELMTQQYGDDPIQEAIKGMEKQHEEDKQEALDKQRMMYERQMQMLRNQIMSPSTPSAPYPSFSPFFDPFNRMAQVGTPNSNMPPKYQQWVQEREKLFKQSLTKLKAEVMKANTLVIEANSLAEEMGKQTEFSVTLQIPAANLSPNRKRGAFVSEPAILVKSKKKGSQVWSMEKFENKIIDMRDMYQERKDKGLPMMVNDQQPYVIRLDADGPPVKGDPFHESQENHNLIGVANIFLEALFYDVKLDYHVPIVSQQGEVAGRLHVELSRVSGTLPERLADDVSSESSGDSSNRNSFVELDEETGVAVGSTIVCRIGIKEARGLPPALSHFVFCQYSFWGHPEPIVVPPMVEAEPMQVKKHDGMAVRFDHEKEFLVHVTEEFMEHCAEGALSLEVWGHRSTGFGSSMTDWELDQVQAKSRSIMDRWSELTRKIQLWTEVHELNEQGEYVPVEVIPKPEVLTGGVFQLRQGHSRRILVQVKPVCNSGTLPIICESITHVSIGCVCARSKLQKGLDSYQEEDLAKLREKWSEALEKRREYLDEQLQRIMNKEEKTEANADRERSLIDQWVCLTEERNAVLVPAAGSGIPGAPADWDPLQGMETHIPVIFLDLNAEDMSTPNVKEGLQAAGMNSILPKEHGAKFFTLPFVKNSDKDVCALVSWDSSIHDSVHLNRVTPANERVYLILKTVVRLSHPASMELVLRKRISINVYKRQSLTDKLRKRIGKTVLPGFTGSDYFQDSLCSSAVMYEIVSNIPKASEDLEDRESLAQIAASQNEQESSDGESYIEKYIRGVSAVESILTLDRLRQEVAIKELLAAKGRPLRKATSVPNIQNILTSPRGLDEQLRADSIQDLSYNDADRYGAKQFPPFDAYRGRSNSTDAVKDSSPLQSKPAFSLARPNFLNLRTNMYSTTKPSPKSATQPSMLGMKTPLKTLVEEQQSNEVKPLLNRNDDDDSEEDEFAKLKESQLQADGNNAPKPVSPQKSPTDSDDFQDFQEFQGDKEEIPAAVGSNGNSKLADGVKSNGIVHSSTTESLVEAQAKGFAPSVTSSGYGSQAVSTHTLSSEDSLSLRSISIDDTPEADRSDSHKTDDNPDQQTVVQEETPDTDKQSANEDEEHKDKDSNNADKTFARSESLIDMDVPLDLDSPMQPTTPSLDSKSLDSKSLDSDRTVSDKTEVDAEEFASVSVSPEVSKGFNAERSTEETESEKADAGSGTCDAKPELLQDTQREEVVPEKIVPTVEAVIVNGEEEEEVANAQDSVVVKSEKSDITTSESTGADIKSETINTPSEGGKVESGKDNPTEIEKNTKNTSTTDIYSEAALDELENLDDSALKTDTFSVENTPVKKDTEKLPNANSHSEEPSQEIKNGSEKVKLRRKGSPGIDRSQRRSWHEKSDRRLLDDSPRQSHGGAPDFKMSKSPSVDLNRAANLKKFRGTETRGGKTAPSPVKATYRPMSMNFEGSTDEGRMTPTDGEEPEENTSDNEDTMSICSFGSRADLHRLGESPIPSWIQLGEPVMVLFSAGGSKNGTVQFIGHTEFAAGNWVGVSLDTPDGKNDGSVKGVRYFRCRNRHGLFVRHDKLIMDKKRKGAKMRNMSSSLRRSTGNLASPQKDTSPGSFMKATAASSAKKK